jgi:hypothetical protein
LISLFSFLDANHSVLVRVFRWVAVVSLGAAVLAVAAENNLDVDSNQIGLIRVNFIGPVFLVSVAVLFGLWVRRNMKQD